jgi:hypothetical protein
MIGVLGPRDGRGDPASACRVPTGSGRSGLRGGQEPRDRMPLRQLQTRAIA